MYTFEWMDGYKALHAKSVRTESVCGVVYIEIDDGNNCRKKYGQWKNESVTQHKIRGLWCHMHKENA